MLACGLDRALDSTNELARILLLFKFRFGLDKLTISKGK